MKRILIVEDDVVVANIYQNKLQNEGYEVEVAPDGQRAIFCAKKERFDLVLLDLGLPGINGVDVLKAIRVTPLNATIPVVVLSNSYVTSLVQAAWKAGANKCLSKASTTPGVLVEVLDGIFAAATAQNTAKQKVEAESPVTAARPREDGATLTRAISPSDPYFQSHVRLALLNNAPGFIEDFRKRLKILASAGTMQSPADMFDFYNAVRALTGHAGSAGYTSIANLCAALEALLKELHEKPKKVGPSPLRTIAQGIDTLSHLFNQQRLPRAEDLLSPLVFVLDDDVIARRTLCAALDKARLRSISIEDPELAYKILAENNCDLIFSDIEMPQMSGFEFCSRIRSLPNHKTTPLVFVTSLSDFESRARSALSGGTDLIAKPFLLVELAVKALTYLLRKQAQLEVVAPSESPVA